MDTVTLAGPLEAKLRTIREAGFSQVMLKANDLVGYDRGVEAAVRGQVKRTSRHGAFRC